MKSSRRIAFGLGAVAGLSTAFLGDRYARWRQLRREKLALDTSDQQRVGSDTDSSNETVDKEASKYFK